MKTTTSNTNSIFGADAQPVQGDPVFVSFKAGVEIDASQVYNTTIVTFGAGDYI